AIACEADGQGRQAWQARDVLTGSGIEAHTIQLQHLEFVQPLQVFEVVARGDTGAIRSLQRCAAQLEPLELQVSAERLQHSGGELLATGQIESSQRQGPILEVCRVART